MKCPSCGYAEDKVIDSRSIRDGAAIRRRRECSYCGRRFTTYEYVEITLMVLKSDGRREAFDRKKLQRGLALALTKRPVSMDTIERLVNEIEDWCNELGKPEVTSAEIGECVMKKLRTIDEVGYIRFASVYRRFQDIGEFRKELESVETKS